MSYATTSHYEAEILFRNRLAPPPEPTMGNNPGRNTPLNRTDDTLLPALNKYSCMRERLSDEKRLARLVGRLFPFLMLQALQDGMQLPAVVPPPCLRGIKCSKTSYFPSWQYAHFQLKYPSAVIHS